MKCAIIAEYWYFFENSNNDCYLFLSHGAFKSKLNFFFKKIIKSKVYQIEAKEKGRINTRRGKYGRIRKACFPRRIQQCTANRRQ
jgi:hypothetical protein